MVASGKQIKDYTAATTPESDWYLVMQDPNEGTPADATKSVIASNFLKKGIPNGQMKNGKLSVTVVSNDLVVALKTLADADPSATDPVYTNINGVEHVLTAALSVTLADATNWMDLGGTKFAALEQDLFAYLGYNATDGVVIGVSRYPYANQYSDFHVTATNEKYARISTITTAAATDPYTVVGRFAATLSGSNIWTVPTFTPTNLIQSPIHSSRIISYVPAWTVLTEGDGVSTGKWQWDGNGGYQVQPNWVYGSTSAMGIGVPTCTLPFTGITHASQPAHVNGAFQDTGTTVDSAQVFVTPTTLTFFAIYTAGNYFTRAALTTLVPFEWAETDTISADGHIQVV